jgi:methyl-accepting chemotaxis protein
MPFPANLNIESRLRLGFALSLVLSACIAAGSIWKMDEARKEMQSVAANLQTSERLVSDWSSHITTAVTRTTAMVESRDPKLAAFFAADAAAASKHNSELMQQVEGLINTAEERTLFAQIVENRRAYQSSRDAVLKLKAEGRGTEAYKVLEEHYLPVARRYQNMVAEFLRLERTQLSQDAQQAAQIEESGRNQVIALAVIVILAGAGVAWWLTTRAGSASRAAAQARATGAPPSMEPAAGDAPVLSSAATARDAASGPPGKWNEFYDILA